MLDILHKLLTTSLGYLLKDVGENKQLSEANRQELFKKIGILYQYSYTTKDPFLIQKALDHFLLKNKPLFAYDWNKFTLLFYIFFHLELFNLIDSKDLPPKVIDELTALLKNITQFLNSPYSETLSKNNWHFFNSSLKNMLKAIRKSCIAHTKTIITEEKISDNNVSETCHAKKLPKGKPKRDTHLWVFKYSYSTLNSIAEVLFQELMRLYTYDHHQPESMQPKTRFAISQNDDMGVISKKNATYKPLSSFPQEMLNPATWNHFASVLLLSILFCEDDLHLGNIGLDANNNVIKIDGNHTFIPVNNKNSMANFLFDGMDIRNLPFLNLYQPYNWLDFRVKNGSAHSKKFLEKLLKTAAHKRDLYRTILRLCTSPEVFIEAFLSHYVLLPSIRNLYNKFILARLQHLIAVIKNDAGFAEYLETKECNEDLSHWTLALQHFKTYGKRCPYDEVSGLASRIIKSFEELKKLCTEEKAIPELEEKLNDSIFLAVSRAQLFYKEFQNKPAADAPRHRRVKTL